MKTNTYNFIFTKGNCFHNLDTHKCVLINGYHNFKTLDEECLIRKWLLLCLTHRGCLPVPIMHLFSPGCPSLSHASLNPVQPVA